MTNRKKRLEKGIQSMKEQIKLHEQKLKQAEQQGKFELARYYAKELEAKRKYTEKKKALLEKA